MKKHQIKPVKPLTDFAQEEIRLLKHWYKSGIVKKYLTKNNKIKKTFSFLDGPITANNPMGVHHGWGRTYKDLWQRYHNLKGYRQRFQNGFDSQGLWVEVEVEKDLGFKSKKDIESYGIAEFVQKCKDWVNHYSKIQTEQSKRLGYFVDWDHSYFTMSDENNYMIWHFLKVCHQNGWLYKGKESVPWCPRCETAISQHEMLTEDYKEVTHKAIYFKLPIIGRKREFLLVWTTTPWTIPANIAIAVDKKLDYSLVKGSTDDKFWVAKDAIQRIFNTSKHKVIKTIKGNELVGFKYKGPFDHLPAVKKVAQSNPNTFHTIVATDQRILSITTNEGTGMVHTAVSAGTEDFKLGKKLGLPMIPVIADDASYLDGLGFLTGKNAKKHPELILDFLVDEDKKPDNDWVFNIENYTHRYPGCWRCKTELVWKVADEWYIAMDKGKPTLRERMIKVAKKIRWIPSFGLDRELDWLNNMHDWLISKKNRYWGLCLPIWECNNCKHFQVIGSKEELEKKAVQGRNQLKGKSPHKPQIDKVKIKCEKCGELSSRIEPVGSPWLDAGIVPFSTIAKNNQGSPLYLKDKPKWRQWFPADFITESFPGQFKNWFYSLIAMSTVLENTNPFKTVLGFATLLAEDGRPMHKSWGNAIEFNEGAEKIGVDVMRWLYASQNPTTNLLFGYKVADQLKRQFHLLLWNSYRFFANYAALGNWQPQQSSPKNSSVLDKWILLRLDNSVKQVTRFLDDFDAFHATQVIEEFVQDLSTWYIRRSRDRIGPNVKDSPDKNACYSTLRTIFDILSRIMAPFTPFITDNIYTNITGNESVHLADWPKINKDLTQTEKTLLTSMTLLRQIVEKGHSKRKKSRLKLRQPLSSITITGYTKKLPLNLHYLVLEELNLKSIVWGKKTGELTVKLVTKLDSKLKAEGQARDIVRQIQKKRRQAGTALNEQIDVELPSWPKEFENYIKQKVLAKSLKKGSSLKILRS